MIKSLSAVLNKNIEISRETAAVLKISIFAALAFAGAMVRIYTPLSPVPFTLQTFFLFIAVYYLKPREIGISQAVYIMAGLIGAPVFAAGLMGGLAFVGPTAGYLAGFIAAGMIMAFMKEKMKVNVLSMAAIFAVGSFVLLGMGTLHLCLVYKVPFASAIISGFAIFVPAELLKIAAAAAYLKIKK